MCVILVSVLLYSVAVQSSHAARHTCRTCESQLKSQLGSHLKSGLESQLNDELSSHDINVHDDGTFTYHPDIHFPDTDTFPVTVDDDVTIHVHPWCNLLNC